MVRNGNFNGERNLHKYTLIIKSKEYLLTHFRTFQLLEEAAAAAVMKRIDTGVAEKYQISSVSTADKNSSEEVRSYSRVA